MLISHGEQMTGEKEEACAERMRLHYGLHRSLRLCEVLRATHPSPPMRTYYRTVEAILGQFAEPRGAQTRLKQQYALRKEAPKIPMDPELRRRIRLLEKKHLNESEVEWLRRKKGVA